MSKIPLAGRTLALLLLPALAGCTFLDGGGPRACTEEFRSYHVEVVDADGSPVEGLESTARVVRTGEVLTTDADPFPGAAYPVATDAHRGAIREGGDDVLFTAEGRGLAAEATFRFRDDGCHVVKVSGPERIVAEAAGD